MNDYDNWSHCKNGRPHPMKEIMENMDAINESWWGKEISEWVDQLPTEIVDQPELLADEIEAAIIVDKLESAEPEPEAVAPTVVQDPPPAPSKPSGWQQLNFLPDPKRQQSTEATKINKWQKAPPSQENWDDASRPYLDS
jgi:hypothetical protein